MRMLYAVPRRYERGEPDCDLKEWLSPKCLHVCACTRPPVAYEGVDYLLKDRVVDMARCLHRQLSANVCRQRSRSGSMASDPNNRVFIVFNALREDVLQTVIRPLISFSFISARNLLALSWIRWSPDLWVAASRGSAPGRHADRPRLPCASAVGSVQTFQSVAALHLRCCYSQSPQSCGASRRAGKALTRLSQLGGASGWKGPWNQGWAVEGLHYMAGFGC